MDMSDEDEDGQISKSEQEDERERRLLGKAEKPLEHAELSSCIITRDTIVRSYLQPNFEELVKGGFNLAFNAELTSFVGSYVRYLIGSDGTVPVYRICEVVSTSPSNEHYNACPTIPRSWSRASQCLSRWRQVLQPNIGAQARQLN